MKNIIRILIVLAFAPVLCHAEKVSLRLDQVSALHSALSQISSGLNPGNVIIASRDINVLQDDAEAAQKATTSAQRKQARLAPGPDLQARMLSVAEELEVAMAHSKDYDLQPLVITEEEIKEAKIPPGQFAIVLRYLPQKK